MWDPDPIAFTVPFLERPVAWYGLLFALGFFIAGVINRRMVASFLDKKEAKLFCERLFSFVFIGTLIGARLGHLMFYERWETWVLNPFQIIKVWEGGLASHGAALAILIALFLFTKKTKILSFWEVVDLVVVPVALAGCFIRLGNFMNQEVLGVPSGIPWAVLFGHPIDGSLPVPRHPVQIYEALVYVVSFFILYRLWPLWRFIPGRITGLFFILIFGSRFLIESIKEGQSAYEIGPLLMGQYLSLPLVVLGLYLVSGRGLKGRALSK
ncbi:MAG: prolipoprotein diacylglyceryl transferase [Simkaniaceae bacterium]|nr:prolipoprotein diacylglyceryl transferase [Simkaniaceae bacterium]